MITVVTATRLEYNAARKALPASVKVVQAGISMDKHQQHIAGTAISCGIAGGLREDLPTGTVVIPRNVRRPDGTIVQCDPEMQDMLATAARSLAHEPIAAPLLTSAALLHGPRRKDFADKGYAAVDMETGLIDAERLACVRVILDTPNREISPAWETPSSVLFHPQAWRDLPFLANEGPRCAWIAARIIAIGLQAGA